MIYCGKCSSGFIFNEQTRTSRHCECVLAESKRLKIEKLISVSGQNVNCEFDKRSEQIKLISAVKDESRSLWIWGKSGSGKSHISARLVKKYIELGKTWSWIEIMDLIHMWFNLYSDKALEIEIQIDKIMKSDIVVINDIDKFNKGKVTPEREAQFFRLINGLKGRLVVTSQYSMKEFFSWMESESYVLERDGISPMMRRLTDEKNMIEISL